MLVLLLLINRLQIPTTTTPEEDSVAILHPSLSRSSSPPPYQRSVNDQQRNDLEASFDESLDASETQQLLTQPETTPQQHHIASASNTNDGVFTNISAKPDTSKDASSGSNETPPVSGIVINVQSRTNVLYIIQGV